MFQNLRTRCKRYFQFESTTENYVGPLENRKARGNDSSLSHSPESLRALPKTSWKLFKACCRTTRYTSRVVHYEWPSSVRRFRINVSLKRNAEPQLLSRRRTPGLRNPDKDAFGFPGEHVTEKTTWKGILYILLLCFRRPQNTTLVPQYVGDTPPV